jgi:hypothetical protein
MTKNDEAVGRILAEVLARKAQGRRDIARRTFAEKIEMMEALRERLAPFKRLREERRAAKAAEAAAHSNWEDAGGLGASASATSAGSNS